MIIAISTLAFGKQSKEEVVAQALEKGWTIEFSSGFPYDAEMIPFFRQCQVPRLAHNYFPAPREPFVINLASKDAGIRARSISHCIQGLELSKQCGAPYFSAHAGFCIDPNPKQLGQKLDVNVPIDRKDHWEIFISSVKTILEEAERLGISFLIENNVCSPFNLREDGQEAFFCCRPEEMVRFMAEIGSDRLGLLLDTAHLKISAGALGFDLMDAVARIEPYVRYVHHSDNDGIRDTNEPIAPGYWFLPYMQRFRDCIHILEIKNSSPVQIEAQSRLLQSHGS